jgi:pseudouridine synthase
MERLNKFLAAAGLASRRGADTLIAAGRVKVNGAVVRELGTQLDPAADRVEVDGRPVVPAPQYEYLILHKPPGYLTTVSDPFDRPTVMKLLPHTKTRIYPVGRLDLDTSGLLFFTNDGALALALTHPRHWIEKEYRALVAGVPSAGELEQLRRGIRLEDGMTAPAKIAIERVENGNAMVRIILREGRKRQVKRMLQAVGHPVRTLQRLRMGPLCLGELQPGQYRPPTPEELAQLLELKAELGRSGR